MLIGSKHAVKNTRPLQIVLDGKSMKQSDYFKYLGIYIDHRLTWNKPVNYIQSRVYPKLNLLNRISSFLSGGSNPQVAGHRSQIAGHRSQVAGRRSQIAGCRGRNLYAMTTVRVTRNVQYAPTPWLWRIKLASLKNLWPRTKFPLGRWYKQGSRMIRDERQ